MKVCMYACTYDICMYVRMYDVCIYVCMYYPIKQIAELKVFFKIPKEREKSF